MRDVVSIVDFCGQIRHSPVKCTLRLRAVVGEHGGGHSSSAPLGLHNRQHTKQQPAAPQSSDEEKQSPIPPYRVVLLQVGDVQLQCHRGQQAGSVVTSHIVLGHIGVCGHRWWRGAGWYSGRGRSVLCAACLCRYNKGSWKDSSKSSLLITNYPTSWSTCQKWKNPLLNSEGHSPNQ